MWRMTIHVCVMCIWYFRTLDCVLQAYHHFFCVCMLKVFLHDGRDRLFKVPLVQRENQGFIHAVFLSKHHFSYRYLTDVSTGFRFLTGSNLAFPHLKVLPERHRNWDPSYPPAQARKPHQICPTHLYLQPHLQTQVPETKLHSWELQTMSWGRSTVGVMFQIFKSCLHCHVLSLKPVIKNNCALEVLTTFFCLFVFSIKCAAYILIGWWVYNTDSWRSGISNRLRTV